MTGPTAKLRKSTMLASTFRASSWGKIRGAKGEAESSDSEDSDETVQRKKKRSERKKDQGKSAVPKVDYYQEMISLKSSSLIEGIQICESILAKS